MKDTRFQICVERMNRIQTFLTCMVIILTAYGISVLLKRTFRIQIKREVILLLLIVGMCFLLTKFERLFPATEILEVEFGEENVTFIRGKKKRSIFYRDIKEVVKMMIINRYYSDKGYYRVKIKTKRRAHVMYSGEDSNERLDFTEVGLSKIYLEFQNRGVKCC